MNDFEQEVSDKVLIWTALILGDENAVYKEALASRRFQSLGLLDDLARLLGGARL